MCSHPTTQHIGGRCSICKNELCHQCAIEYKSTMLPVNHNRQLHPDFIKYLSALRPELKERAIIIICPDCMIKLELDFVKTKRIPAICLYTKSAQLYLANHGGI